MHRTLLKSKIHRARVTDANIHYEGSITLDAALMQAADILPWEKVQVWDVTNGARLETYAIPGKERSGVVCINGAAAHHVQVGDVVIIATYAEMEEKDCRDFEPKRVLVDERNNVVIAREPEGRSKQSPMDSLEIASPSTSSGSQ